MSEGAFFTRANWRPGKRHTRQLRTKPWGGCKVAPPAFVEAGRRYGFKPGRPGYRVCSAIKRDGSPCGMLALKDLKVCGAHGGYGIWATQGKLKRSGKGAAIKAERAAAIEGRVEPPLQDLARLRVYQLADERSRMKMARAYGTSSWVPLMKQLTRQGAIEYCV